MDRQASVVVPTFDRPDRLLETLRPLVADPATAEVIVVDDGHDDQATRVVVQIDDAKLRPICIPNSGRAKARQVGLDHATADVVVLLDDDVVADPGLITRHVALAQPGRVVVGYMPTPAPAARPGRFSADSYIGHYEAHCRLWEQNPYAILQHLWGGNVSMMRQDALAVGIYNPQFDAHYHDDYEFGLRLHDAGLKAMFSRELRATHVHQFTISTYLRNARKQGHDWPIIHALHPEIGPYDPEHISRGKLGPLIRATRRPRLYRIASALSPLAASKNVATLLARVEHQQGALAACGRSIRGG